MLSLTQGNQRCAVGDEVLATFNDDPAHREVVLQRLEQHRAPTLEPGGNLRHVRGLVPFELREETQPTETRGGEGAGGSDCMGATRADH